MVRSSLRFLLVAILVVHAGRDPCRATDDDRAAQTKASSRVLVSERVVLKDVVYSLEAEGPRLFLASQLVGDADRHVTREALDFSGADDGRPVELSLAVMGEKNLMAVVKLRRDHEYDFYCLTFIGRPKNDAASTDFKFFQAKFHSTPHNFKILGISGKHAEGSALVVLGKIPDPSVPTTGLIYFSGCPWPPSDGLLLPFQATPQTADSDDR